MTGQPIESKSLNAAYSADGEGQFMQNNVTKHFPDFPSKLILFRDICPILKNPGALTTVIDLFEEREGFLFGSLLAQRLGVGFVLVRKMGKLPGPTLSVAHNLEYGEAEVKIQEDAVAPEQKVLINDLLATGGTLYAACELMKKQNAEVMGCMVVIELSGVEKLKPNTLFSLVQY
ncbi:adenine phosphoribosyltransferase-like [Oncorhynchus mykiss]|uniref:adenine phosphoribosyltransferase-like n=1 Tax=Oncorhynchus mykiss TaxID=8022 RepID=UPI001878200F|nr:adenine phosphoribosyltransferase-like [Oncorhynchus mykiss]